MKKDRPRPLMKELSDAIKAGDKKAILSAYEKLEKIDWHLVSFKTGEEYDTLVDQANDILYS